VATLKAHPQMHPAISGLDAVFADVLRCARNFDLIEMCTVGCDRSPFSDSSSDHQGSEIAEMRLLFHTLEQLLLRIRGRLESSRKVLCQKFL